MAEEIMRRLGLFGLSPLTLGTAFAICAAIIFGMHTPAERGFYAEGGRVIMIMVATLWARALMMAIYCLAARQKLFQTRENTRQGITGGLLQVFATLTMLASLLYIPGPVAVVIAHLHTLMLLFFMAWRREMKLDVITIVTTLAALVGLSAVIDFWHYQSDINWLGIGLAFLSAIATASRLYVYGHQTKDRHPIVVAAENFLIAAPVASLFLFFAPSYLPISTKGLIWLAVASASIALGTFFMFYGISLLGAFRYSLFAKLEPIFTSLFSIWFLGEFLKPVQYIGIAIVVGSLTLYQISEQKRIKRA